MCLRYMARVKFRALLSKYTIDFLVASAIEEASKVAFVGFKLEGVTPMQYLRRAGYGDIAHTIETFLKEKPLQFRQITMKSLLSSASPAKIGITGEILLKNYRKFQEFWRKSSVSSRLESLKFIDYLTSWEDTRSVADSIRDAEKSMLKMFLKVYPNNATRIKACMKAILSSRFPLTGQQISVFLVKYAGKPSLAQDNIHELVNIPTLPSELEEAKVCRLYLIAVKKIAVILRGYMIQSIAVRLDSLLIRAEAMLLDPSFRYIIFPHHFVCKFFHFFIHQSARSESGSSAA